MIYLYWYLGIGAAVLAIVYGAHRLTKKDESESLRDLLDAMNPERKKLSHRVLNNYVVPVFAAMAVVIVWPLAVYMKGKDLFSKKSASALEKEREFAVELGHLHETLTVPQIEVRELVADPMGAVPSLPFGHLNAAWKTFLEGVGVNDELWSFKAPWQTTWGRKEIRTGYVVVRDGAPASHFLTVRREGEYEPTDDQAPNAVSAGVTTMAR